ncbi:MAG6450 family protein [Furfurilactobacillus milii]|uniref:MAG6450 family protein n=1 Tax=Furfurilactobacillus milii TaxID=2888272 RepID=UPI001F3012DD|nr:hypothetical protein [Furfurilactobacillus milii]MCF6419840.1 hypothetical protein [Furfurilactobacillus milii]
MSHKSLKKLTDKDQAPTTGIVSKLTDKDHSSVKFKLSIEGTLDSSYGFKNLRTTDAKAFSQFLIKTVGRELTITQAEDLFLRTDGPHGPKNEEEFYGETRKMMHFDNGSRDFRIHGYYNDDSYFVICRIDPHHKFKY